MSHEDDEEEDEEAVSEEDRTLADDTLRTGPWLGDCSMTSMSRRSAGGKAKCLIDTRCVGMSTPAADTSATAGAADSTLTLASGLGASAAAPKKDEVCSVASSDVDTSASAAGARACRGREAPGCSQCLGEDLSVGAGVSCVTSVTLASPAGMSSDSTALPRHRLSKLDGCSDAWRAVSLSDCSIR